MTDIALGAFARLWRRTTPGEVAAAMAASGLKQAQWNFSAIGMPTVSAAISPDTYREVRASFDDAGVRLWGMSCTYNIIHPDCERRAHLQAEAIAMIRRAPLLGVQAVTICAGSRDPSGWAYHPDNVTMEAWSDMHTSLRPLLDAAGEAGVVIGIEPEPGCIVRDTAKTVQLLDELGTDAPVTIILDAWNLTSKYPERKSTEVLRDAFASLGRRAGCLHAKDPLGKQFRAPVLDYGEIAHLYHEFTPGRPVIIQDIEEDGIAEVAAYLRGAWDVAERAHLGRS